jgi:hypothetical protein
LFACKSEKQKQAIAQTDKMLTKIEILKKSLTSPEVESYRAIFDTVKIYNAYFQNLPANFERNDSIMNIIDNYGTVEKCFKKLHSVHIAKLLDGLELSKSQITNLKSDIEEGFFEDSEIDKYVKIEDSILNDIEVIVNQKLEFAKAHKAKYEIYHPLVLKLISDFEEKYK